MSNIIQIFTQYPIIPLFLLANLAIGFWAYRKSKSNSFEDYALASRSLPTAVLVMTFLATCLDSGYLASSDYTYSYGILGFAHLCGFLVTFSLVATCIAPRLVYFDQCLTSGEVMGVLYGDLGRILAGVANLFFSFGIVGSQIQAMTVLANAFFGIPQMHAVILFGGVVVLYSVFGGMRAVSYTDVFQLFAAFIALTWVLQAVWKSTEHTAFAWSSLQEGHKLDIVAHPRFVYKIKSLLFWNTSLAWILTPPIVQRMLVVQDKKDVKKMWYIGAFVLGLIVSMIMLIGFMPLANKTYFQIEKTPDNLLLYLSKLLFAKHPLVIEMLFLGFLSLGVSTMDSYLHSAGLAFVHDIISPIRKFVGAKVLTSQQKTTVSRLGILAIGVLALGLGAVNSVLENKFLHIVIIYGYTIISIPLVIGIVGIKTDKTSWGGFVVAYALSVALLYTMGWSKYGNFVLSAGVGTLAYFLTHIYVHGGIVILKRYQYATVKKEWKPSVQDLGKGIIHWMRTTFNLVHGARVEVSEGRPVQSLMFSVLMLGMYVLGSIVMGSQGGDGFVTFMGGIRFVGIALCCGLMLEGIWLRVLKHYFPLYWLTTLWYCLPFAGTLAFLRMHEGLASFCFFVGSFMLLAMFVTTRTFLWLAVCGFGLSHLGWCAVYGSLPADLWTSGTYVGACLVLGMLALAVLASGHGLERHIAHNLYVKRALAGAVTHEVMDPLEVTSDASFLVFQISQGLTPIKNASGEKGFFLPEKEGTAFTKIPDRMEDAMEDIRKEFYRYGQMLRKNIYLEKQEKISLSKLINEALPDVTKRYQGTIDVKVTCKQDFEAYMLTELFDTVLRNLVKNAKRHGKATQLEITIDGEGRKVYFRDNGLGIPAELLTRIFDFGFTTSSASNYGIGLPLVNTILDVSGVKMICRSHHGDEDSFTEFVMTFPEV